MSVRPPGHVVIALTEDLVKGTVLGERRLIRVRVVKRRVLIPWP